MCRLGGAFLVAAATACRGRNVPGPTESGQVAPALVASASQDAGAGNVSGRVGGRDFGGVASAFRIESPDSNADTVVYLFSTPVRCLDLSLADWDDRLDPNTMVLELHLVGRTPGSYLAVDSPEPAAHEAIVRASQASARGGPRESRATGGWITVEALSRGGPASGAFELTFGTQPVTGRFDAEFCGGGHEP
jgi:hypothetical protein